MADIRRVTEAFAVAPQINEEDVAQIEAAGFKTIVANRPDGEGGVDQPRMGAIRAKAESLGLTFVALPFSGAPTPEVVERMSNILNEAPQPVLAYCRTGTRCITAWALTHSGQGTGQEIVDAAADAGYDLSSLQSLL
ncbi:TIGR01244 family sulfur transferase [Hyphomonas sp.]|jgi:sulfide:quinone oxidoreductase|uniref:TIGR01244 family sulfur transferase n=1 Tax=Hyphomonas sp. TaxID=87 RepID=UPI000C696F28|nr:TIGR01244 family phosphatase [Hyphomonadaceae bacterium]MBA28978.1 TIGR01244 family phosphatase [Hyphomonadaceae bacterium]|tara:strand:+ start:1600 stop:2010 length:411 start_codon:yes stop_codon:yes gene_type:complete